MLNKIMRMFSGGGSTPSPEKKDPEVKKQGGIKDLENFVDYVVKALVDKPEEVKIQSKENGDSGVIEITCAREDMGKVIGKSGKTIMSIRSLVSGAAGRLGRKISVEVLE